MSSSSVSGGVIMKICPECGESYLFEIPSRLDNFSVKSLYRHKKCGRVFFHEIKLEQEVTKYGKP